ncbi:uncharacterized protein LOC128985530 [Macrosteles quadrilineatus]|uniref:uncharacterized protein LOC128982000 n=1 Tax=Macrosteles quadrilineatus TaxID=74068 RepID=UPI0023E2DBB6|nr:uncharacterized protein LOC128982000 [Macrosteles quadrilineatus]XP_054261092.1 uncharacterized protein LOC128985530 [Macrosteles quadrilineatus]
MRGLDIALAQVVLSASSGYSLYWGSDLKFVRIAFGLCLINGVVGILDYGLSIKRRITRVRELRDYVDFLDRVSRKSYTPLVAAEALVFIGHDKKSSLSILVYPFLYIVLTELLEERVNQDKNIVFVFNLNSICYSILLSKDYLFGGTMLLLNMAAFWMKQHSRTKYFLTIGVANLAALQYFKQLFD